MANGADPNTRSGKPGSFDAVYDLSAGFSNIIDFEASFEDLVAALGENSLIGDIDPLTLTKVLQKTNPELASDAFQDSDSASPQ